MALFIKRDNNRANALAGAVGLVVGAAGTAAVYAMSNPKTRKMIAHSFNDVRERASEGIKYMMDTAKKIRENVKERTKK